MSNQQNNGFSATDMATAAASGYREGAASDDGALLDYIELEWFEQGRLGEWRFALGDDWDAGRHKTLRAAIRSDMKIREGGSTNLLAEQLERLESMAAALPDTELGHSIKEVVESLSHGISELMNAANED